jgi:hypothetical protein
MKKLKGFTVGLDNALVYVDGPVSLQIWEEFTPLLDRTTYGFLAKYGELHQRRTGYMKPELAANAALNWLMALLGNSQGKIEDLHFDLIKEIGNDDSS